MSNELQGLLVVMASLSHGLEQVLGRGAAPVTFRAGRTVGLKSEVKRKEADPLPALEVLAQELGARGIVWPFELWKPKSASDYVYSQEGKSAVKLVFRNCLVRNSLFRYGHPQKLSLCLMNHGLFCGLLDKVHGGKSNLEILHAGENACLKVLTVERESEVA